MGRGGSSRPTYGMLTPSTLCSRRTLRSTAAASGVTPDTICSVAGQVALSYVYGTGLVGFDPRTARDAATIVVWGANPSASAPHTHEHWLAKAPGRVIVIDPVRTPTAAVADLHLQPYPGSDAALAFALLHVLWRNGLVDRGFVAAHDGVGRTRTVAEGLHPRVGRSDDGCPRPPHRGGGS